MENTPDIFLILKNCFKNGYLNNEYLKWKPNY